MSNAYSVDWTVQIDPEGDVSEDVSEIIIVDEPGVDAATVKLDTTRSPHALEEDREIFVQITDGNETKTFNGWTDSVSDHGTKPIVTVDARTAPGLLDDTNAVGVVESPDLWGVIEAVLDQSAGEVREITFDVAAHRDAYGKFADQLNFGRVEITSTTEFDPNYYNESWEQREIANQDLEAEIRWDYYQNTGTDQAYELTFTGQDQDLNTVTASINLPPGSDAQAAYGSDKLRLPMEGGNKMMTQIDSIDTTVPQPTNLPSGATVNLAGDVWNYVKTDWRFRVNDLTSTRQAISGLVSYMSGVDLAEDWEYYVDNSLNELFVHPESDQDPDRHVLQEGDNVLKPVASRDLDGVRNMVKVSGAFDVAFWAWAYGGDFRYSFQNPFDSGDYPSGGTKFDDSPGGGLNDIDNRNIRADSFTSDSITSSFQAFDIGKRGLRELYRTPVTGQAPMEGVKAIDVGDEVEVFYPSRGIPQKVASNIYSVKKVEYQVRRDKAVTTVDFGTKRANLADQILAGGSVVRNDISDTTARYSDSITTADENTKKEDRFPLVGELIEQNPDDTWQVKSEDGETYDRIRII